MTTVNDTYINALLADAAYVDNLNLAVTPGDLAAALSGRMTPDLANFIGKNFTVKTQASGLNSSFDATVWQGNAETEYAGKIYVSMRGTQEALDFIQDYELAMLGTPTAQLADMVNWWLRAAVPASASAPQNNYVAQNESKGGGADEARRTWRKTPRRTAPTRNTRYVASNCRSTNGNMPPCR